MHRLKLATIFATLLLSTAPANASGDVAVTAGLFRFYATDYYYPVFYEEAGFRGEIVYSREAHGRWTARLLVAGYPMDDNIFDPAAEIAWRPEFGWHGWRLGLEPTVGFGVTKLQYPAPYYPVVEHHFLPWFRFGGDIRITRNVINLLSFSAVYRFRTLYYTSDWHPAFTTSQNGEPCQLLHTPFGEVSVKVNDRWRLIGRGGCEWGGYYDAVFLPKEKKARPYGELGFGLTL